MWRVDDRNVSQSDTRARSVLHWISLRFVATVIYTLLIHLKSANIRRIYPSEVIIKVWAGAQARLFFWCVATRVTHWVVIVLDGRLCSAHCCLDLRWEIAMTVQTVNVASLKNVKNSVIGNPTAKLALAKDEAFVEL